jgi:hypothetical protein
VSLKGVNILIFVLLNFVLNAQKITNVDFKVVSNELKISYDIEDGQKNMLYDIKVLIQLENRVGSGISKTITPKSISGDFQKVKSGKGKTIKWDVLRDIKKLEGDIIVVVRISKSHILNPDNKWGPEAAFTSLVFPGLGNYLVNKNENSAGIGVYTFLGYAGSLYLAYESKKSSDENYATYQNSTTQSEMDLSYEKANNQNKIAVSMVGVAGVILATEFVYVLIKGTSNKFKKEYALGRYPKINLVYQGGNCGLRISKAF